MLSMYHREDTKPLTEYVTDTILAEVSQEARWSWVEEFDPIMNLLSDNLLGLLENVIDVLMA